MSQLKNPINITGMASVSALGMGAEEIWQQYKKPEHQLRQHDFGDNKVYAAFLKEEAREAIEALRNSSPHFTKLDPSVLFAVFTARNAMKQAQWQRGESIGINIGSSRGATSLFENYHRGFLENGKAETLSSPSTTLGNISSWVAQDLQSSGPEVSHSVTCSTGLHSVLNGIAWLQAGLCDKFMTGGSEAALTPFSISQMQAMKIYAQGASAYPCESLKMDKTRNSMVLGEGAAVLCLENNPQKDCLARITGIGYATEILEHSVSLSANGTCFQKAMCMALGALSPTEIDAVVLHAPGTVKGDNGELNAIKKVFGDHLPALTTNKWKLGHTFGASGVLSMELAILMLQRQEFIPVPFSEFQNSPKQLNNILVNAVGFGGNAVSLLLSRA